jgi:adenine-specific DNA-methyltransferase
MSTFEEFKSKLGSLVEHFDSNIEYYKSKDYKEDHLRQEFLNPFFKALGWDMDNEAGNAPQYREIIHEDRIEIEGKPKAPDYSFRIGSERKFFVEAKAASVKIYSEVAPTFQLRRYAWSGKLQVSVLTDFEEFAVYDTTIEPKVTDKSDTARIKYITYKDYLNEADYLWNTFSRDAVWKGSFDKFAKREKRGNQLVDKSFLSEIESWRNLLAKDIATNNPKINIFQLNKSVQKIIDRIIFLRIAEDRGIENYEALKKTIESENTYPQLIKLFKKAQEKYNSNLFNFEIDQITPKLKISDKVMDRIIGTLYFPRSPFEFSVIGVEILGSVYEQFLGKVIRLTKGHNAVIEEKPEVKKAGGVYYTPQYIVDYIVKNTVGELLRNITLLQTQGDSKQILKKVSELKIVDPACGSGSFLIGAYNYLLDWHLRYYIDNAPDKFVKSKALFKDNEGNYLLSTSEKKRILTNNIYGVDIDHQAVEVTKLSLALKMLENENKDSISAQLKIFAERILPDLSSNIKCGNSLIGSDYWEGKDLTSLTDEEIRKVNAFDWDKEFPSVFKQGGFDAVIGNPPYVRQESLREFKGYFAKNYKTYHGMADLYVYFIEKSIDLLNKNGLYGVIVANKWMRAGYGEALRAWLQNRSIQEITDFGDLPVFGKVSAYPCILISKSTISKENHNIDIANIKTLDFNSLRDEINKIKTKTQLSKLSKDGWALVNSREQELMEKLKKTGIPLKEYVNGKIYYGIKTGFNEAFVIDKSTKEQLIKEDPKSAEVIKPFLGGRDVKRYAIPFSMKYIIFAKRGINIVKYKAIRNYLENFKDKLMPKPKGYIGKWGGRASGSYEWYELQASPENVDRFETHKIVIPAITKYGSYSMDYNNYYSNDKTTVIPIEDYYLLGILNSRVSDYFIHNFSPTKQGGYYEYKPTYIQKIPIPETTNPNEIIRLVKNQLETQKSLHSEGVSETQKKLLSQQAERLDQQIDKLVYELYGLTEEEIGIVEGGN